MSWRNLEGNHENSGERAMEGWLPEISDCGIGEVVCVAGKNPNENGEGYPNLVPVAMIAAKPDEVIGKPRYRQNLEAIRCRLKI